MGTNIETGGISRIACKGHSIFPAIMGTSEGEKILTQFSQSTKEAPIIPVSVAPELANAHSAQRVNQVAEETLAELGVLIKPWYFCLNLDLEIQQNPVTVPVNFGVAWEFESKANKLSIAGPWMPSLGHPIANMNISSEAKVYLIQEMILNMFAYFDAVVIGFPDPMGKGRSFTEEIFCDPAVLGGLKFSIPTLPNIAFYYFVAHGGAIDLQADSNWQQIVAKMYTATNQNFLDFRAATEPAEMQQRGQATNLYLHTLLRNYSSEEK